MQKNEYYKVRIPITNKVDTRSPSIKSVDMKVVSKEICLRK